MKVVFESFKEEVLFKIGLERKLVEKEEILNGQNKKIDALESELQVVRRVSDLALENCYNVEQYTRRHSLRVYGIPVETNEDVVSKIDEFCRSVDIPFNKSDVDRAHRVGLKKVDKVSNQHMQPVIVKFKDWNSRYKLLYFISIVSTTMHLFAYHLYFLYVISFSFLPILGLISRLFSMRLIKLPVR